MIHRLVYVACDRCGQAAGDSDDMRTDAADARVAARRYGYRYVPGRGDFCPSCSPTEATPPTGTVTGHG